MRVSPLPLVAVAQVSQPVSQPVSEQGSHGGPGVPLTRAMSRIALIHPPALSPAVFAPLTAALEAAGHQVAVPDYTGELSMAASWWRRATLACVTAIDGLVGNAAPAPEDREGARTYRANAPGPDVLVAFSGAGVLMPLVCNTRPPGTAVFLDATLPTATERESLPSAQVRSMVAGLRAEHPGDRLPRWTRWWPEAELATLLPDAAMRATLDAQAPELPADFYDEGVGTAPGWEPPKVAYVQLTGAYDAEAKDAATRGWSVVAPADTGIATPTHLSLMTDPQALVPLLVR